ncbi:caspase family protein [Streptomyces sp. NBC_01304]|uniref:caspase family protein n=1 Tax=Streptomyces sp. NBC_01304 TaxID=2903818 RepID=UPI002E0F6C15|nr:caspase family protein [Streptomyces sp. NBC_01304]
MGLYRALLIGASDYEMRGVQPLGFIPGDLARLGSILRTHGFHDVQVLAAREGGRQVSANYINGGVIGFLRRARRGDTLFILLSGHGVHARGQDYLVPEDIDEDVHPFESGCVPIDWRRHLDETPAEHVVFLIDACREGIDQDSMGVSGVREWGRQKIGAALRRKVAYLYACSPAQLSLFVRGEEQVRDGLDHGTLPGESFSLFSRSVSDVVASRTGGEPLALDEFVEAVQNRVTELHRAYRKKGRAQLLRVVTDIPADGFFFLPGVEGPAVAAPRPPEASPVVAPDDTDTVVRDGAAMSLLAEPGPSLAEPGPSLEEAGAPPWGLGPPPAMAQTVRSAPPPPRDASAPDEVAPGQPPKTGRRRWVRRALIAVAVLLVVLPPAGLFTAYQVTRDQYFVGSHDRHIAIYRGVHEKVLWISYWKLERDHPEIELKYLNSYQREYVEEAHTVGSVAQAQITVDSYAVQVSTCKKIEAAGIENANLSKEEKELAYECP